MSVTIGVPDDATVGSPVTLTATVDPVPDGGTVAFASDGYYLPDCESQPVDPTTGEATCTTSTDFVAASMYEIDAVYSGDDSYQASQGTSASLLMVSPGPTTVTVDTPIPDAASVGQLVTLTATVNPVPDGGTVEFESNGQAIAGCDAQIVDETDGDALPARRPSRLRATT